MKEKFRNWNFQKVTRVTYRDGTGSKQVWIKNQAEWLEQILSIVKEFSSQGIKLTNRQLYYQLVASDIIPNAEETSMRLSAFLTNARYAGHIDWDMIEDRGRVPDKHPEWNNIKMLVQSAIQAYRLPRWSDQEFYVELFCEKQALESVLKPIANKYHIYFSYNKGYTSSSSMYDLAKRLKREINNGKHVKLLYFGDHDPSGLDMVRDVHDRIQEFLTQGASYTKPDFEVLPLALTMEQIRKFNPPPNPAKIKDPRAKRYISKFGSISWELDALRPDVLMLIAEHGILEWLNKSKYDVWIEKEKQQSQELIEFSETLAGEEE